MQMMASAFNAKTVLRHLLDSRLAGVHKRPGLSRVEGNECLSPIWSTRNEWLVCVNTENKDECPPITEFLLITPCKLISLFQCFRGTCRLLVQGD